MHIKLTKVMCIRMFMRQIAVLRLGHRLGRDQRMTTHVGLTARAFGANCMLIAAQDMSIEKNMDDITRRWGEKFFVRSGIKWKDKIVEWRGRGGKVCHLTMYGINLPDVIDDVRAAGDILVVVGAEKVPAEIYGMADWNIAIGNQPHSEVAALAIFLDRLHGGEELSRVFKGGELHVVPMERGKEVRRVSHE